MHQYQSSGKSTYSVLYYSTIREFLHDCLVLIKFLGQLKRKEKMKGPRPEAYISLFGPLNRGMHVTVWPHIHKEATQQSHRNKKELSAARSLGRGQEGWLIDWVSLHAMLLLSARLREHTNSTTSLHLLEKFEINRTQIIISKIKLKLLKGEKIKRNLIKV